MAKFILGAQERVKKDDSIPVELLPSNKILYCARLNSDEEADVTPTKCNNLKGVFEKYQPSFNVEMETEDGEPINTDFEIRAMKDFSSKDHRKSHEDFSNIFQPNNVHYFNNLLAAIKIMDKDILEDGDHHGLKHLVQVFHVVGHARDKTAHGILIEKTHRLGLHPFKQLETDILHDVLAKKLEEIELAVAKSKGDRKKGYGGLR